MAGHTIAAPAACDVDRNAQGMIDSIDTGTGSGHVKSIKRSTLNTQ